MKEHSWGDRLAGGAEDDAPNARGGEDDAPIARGDDPRPMSVTEEPRAPRALRIAASIAILILAFAGTSHELWGYDEPREAEIARALWRSGEWTYTVLNEQPFLEKPPLFSITVAAAFALVGGPSILAARAVAALWSLGTLGVVAWFARRTAGKSTALLAALVLATTKCFVALQHTIILDNALTAFTTAALACGWLAAHERRHGLALLAGAALAGAFLVKGSVGVALVVLVLGLDLAWRRDGAGARALLRPMVLVTATVPPILYALLLGVRGGPDYLRELLWDNQLGRFLHGYGARSTPFYFYALEWWEMVLPWTPLALVALLRRPTDAVGRFARLWAVAPLVLLSFSQGRSRSYTLPVTPAHALLVALLWRDLRLEGSWRRVLAWSWTVAAAAIAGLSVVTLAIGEGDASSVLAGLVALATLPARRATTREARGLGLGLVVFAGWLLWVSDFATCRREPPSFYRDLAQSVRAAAGPRRLVLYHVTDSYSGIFGFYADQSVLGFDDVNDTRGERLLAAVTSGDVVLAPPQAVEQLPAPQRRQFDRERTFIGPRQGENVLGLYRWGTGR